MPESTEQLLPSNFKPRQIGFIPYNHTCHGQQMANLVGHCFAPAHNCRFVSSAATIQIFQAERKIRRATKRRSQGARFGTRLAFYRDKPVATYGLVLDNQGVLAGPSICGYIDNLLVPTGLENRQPLLQLIFDDIETQVLPWSLAAQRPITLGLYGSKPLFGEAFLAPLDFIVGAQNISTRAYGEATLYTRTYIPGG